MASACRNQQGNCDEVKNSARTFLLFFQQCGWIYAITAIKDLANVNAWKTMFDPYIVIIFKLLHIVAGLLSSFGWNTGLARFFSIPEILIRFYNFFLLWNRGRKRSSDPEALTTQFDCWLEELFPGQLASQLVGFIQTSDFTRYTYSFPTWNYDNDQTEKESKSFSNEWPIITEASCLPSSKWTRFRSHGNLLMNNGFSIVPTEATIDVLPFWV